MIEVPAPRRRRARPRRPEQDGRVPVRRRRAAAALRPGAEKSSGSSQPQSADCGHAVELGAARARRAGTARRGVTARSRPCRARLELGRVAPAGSCRGSSARLELGLEGHRLGLAARARGSRSKRRAPARARRGSGSRLGARAGRGPRSRTEARLGLEQDVVGHRPQVGVEVAAEDVAQQRAHVASSSADSSRGDSPSSRKPPAAAHHEALQRQRGLQAALHLARSPSSAHSAASRSAEAGLARPRRGVEQRAQRRAGSRTAPRPRAARAQPISKRPSAQATVRRRVSASIAVEELAEGLLLAGGQHPAGSPRPAPRAAERAAAASAPGPRAASRARRGVTPPGATAAARSRPRGSARRPRPAGRLVGRHVALEHAQRARRAVVARADRLGGASASPRTSERPPPSSTRSASIQPVRAARPRARARRRGPASLDLLVDALEALLGEAEAGGVLVQALEHRRSAGSACSPRRPCTRSQADAPAPSARQAGWQVGSPRSRGQRSSMNSPVRGW